MISHCGSFTAIRGGHNFPYLVRSTPCKPLRVFLQSGAADADIIFGSWPLANQEMAAALDFAGYDHRFEFGTGGHNLRHGGAIFAETLRWVFRLAHWDEGTSGVEFPAVGDGLVPSRQTRRRNRATAPERARYGSTLRDWLYSRGRLVEIARFASGWTVSNE